MFGFSEMTFKFTHLIWWWTKLLIMTLNHFWKSLWLRIWNCNSCASKTKDNKTSYSQSHVQISYMGKCSKHKQIIVSFFHVIVAIDGISNNFFIIMFPLYYLVHVSSIWLSYRYIEINAQATTANCRQAMLTKLFSLPSAFGSFTDKQHFNLFWRCWNLSGWGLSFQVHQNENST